jgi:predicted GTPase
MKSEHGIPELHVHQLFVDGSQSPPALTEYTQAKFQVTHQVRLLEQYFQRRQNKERAEECHSLLVKLAEDRFTLAVVGQFKRGKSSLMNALILEELLPTGVLPLTSAITILRFGPCHQLVVTYQESHFDSQGPLSNLKDFVTEEGNPGNAKNIRAVYVETPSPFLRRGLEFVDTPGIGSAIEANTETTYSFIPNCDAVLFVTGVDAPMTDCEMDFLRRLQRDVGKLFCVVNKIDLLDEPQRSQAIAFATTQIRRSLGNSEVRVFPVSSRIALSHHGGDAYQPNERSGISELRYALGEFLSNEKNCVLLKAIIERLLRLIAADRSELSLAHRAAAMSVEVRRQQVSAIHAWFDSIRRSISQQAESSIARFGTLVAASAESDLDERIRREVIRLADGLASSSRGRHWHSARSFIAEISRETAERACVNVNAWLGRQQRTLTATLGEAERELRDAAQRLVQASDASCGNCLDEIDLSVGGPEVEKFHVECPPWSPVPRWYLRNLPVGLIRPWLRQWMHDRVQRFVSELRAQAIRQVGLYVNDRLQLITQRIDAALGQQEERLAMTISSNDGISPAKHLELIRKIECSLTCLLQKADGQISEVPPPDNTHSIGSVTTPVFTDSSPAQITVQRVSEDLRKGGCPVCRYLSNVLFDFLASWQYLLARDDAAQRQYAAELGFCPLHTWQLEKISSPRGMSVGYPRLVERLRTELSSIATEEFSAAAVRRLTADAKTCKACQMLASIQAEYIDKLAEVLGNDDGRRSYAAAHGVCLCHLPSLLTGVPTSLIRRFIFDQATAHLEILGEDMQSFALKQEATRRELLNSNERKALQTALEKVVGVKAICYP